MKWNILLAALLLAVTGCGTYEAEQSSSSSSLSLDCDEDCITPEPQNLEVKAHLGGNGSEYSVPADLAEWNMGGDCNEGGFPHNVIRWELHLNGVKKRDSGMGGLAGTGPANSRCVNGRFLLYVNLRSIPEDPVNRTGLRTGSGTQRASYELIIEILGQKSQTDTNPARNGLKGQMRVSLHAI